MALCMLLEGSELFGFKSYDSRTFSSPEGTGSFGCYLLGPSMTAEEYHDLMPQEDSTSMQEREGNALT